MLPIRWVASGLAIVLLAGYIGYIKYQAKQTELECATQRAEIAETVNETNERIDENLEKLDEKQDKEDVAAGESVATGRRNHFDNTW